MFIPRPAIFKTHLLLKIKIETDITPEKYRWTPHPVERLSRPQHK
ncbi:Hypothetical protein ETEE_3868 [Edwardsiella anguillarum ET080813]|uniref:Uncharacterized protein n=1 Tax=Edwardsiella anguillarum ET080813 TaxID=667120 RepID=A0A076LV04_9GAMM|nr:Hypothetical protein ETEE_3868 [Edwardsiella anguillarum ET080813]